MSDPLAAAKLKAEKAYNAAADYFDAEPLAFWARYGRRTVERLRLRRGAHVLDVCCGTGASALPAAQGCRPRGPGDRGRARGRAPQTRTGQGAGRRAPVRGVPPWGHDRLGLSRSSF